MQVQLSQLAATVAVHDERIAVHDKRLGVHDERLAVHDQRLVVHDEKLAVHDKRLLVHDAQFCQLVAGQLLQRGLDVHCKGSVGEQDGASQLFRFANQSNPSGMKHLASVFDMAPPSFVTFADGIMQRRNSVAQSVEVLSEDMKSALQLLSSSKALASQVKHEAQVIRQAAADPTWWGGVC